MHSGEQDRFGTKQASRHQALAPLGLSPHSGSRCFLVVQLQIHSLCSFRLHSAPRSRWHVALFEDQTVPRRFDSKHRQIISVSFRSTSHEQIQACAEDRTRSPTPSPSCLLPLALLRRLIPPPRLARTLLRSVANRVVFVLLVSLSPGLLVLLLQTLHPFPNPSLIATIRRLVVGAIDAEIFLIDPAALEVVGVLVADAVAEGVLRPAIVRVAQMLRHRD